MGIPYYVASLLRKHKHIQRDTGNALLECDVLGLDFNCFIHTYLQPENPIGSIVVALRNLLRDTVRAKKVLIAFDGLVPYAKIVQQRYRRMRAPDAEQPFDKHQISPGTEFMKELEDTLRYVFPECELSGTDEPGEGEHKIFTWLRTVENRSKIVIYGLDADLVLISVAQSSLGSIRLLRENREGGFSAFDVDALKAVLPCDPDMWVQMCVLSFGNDFMPTIAMFSLREDGYGRALHCIKKESFFEEITIEEENRVLLKRAKDKDRKFVATDGHALEARVGIHLLDGILDWGKVTHAFWKTYAWTLHYFRTSEVLDWCWYYPYADAPLVQTLNDFEVEFTFEWEYPKPPYGIQDQLNFILPSHSLHGPSAFLDELYEEGADSRHPWMKSFAWETDPYISLPWNPSMEKTTVMWLPTSEFEADRQSAQPQEVSEQV